MKKDKQQGNRSMGIISNKYSEPLAWVKFALNPGEELPTITNWRVIFDFCDKQKIGGVCEPTPFDVHVEDEVLLDWMALLVQLRKSNSLLNKRVNDYFAQLESDGLQCCLLKGQGNATMYPDPLMRLPGDIDVWIDWDKKSIDEYFTNMYPEAKQSFKHLKVYNGDTPVDIHDTPLKLYNPSHHKRLQKWLEENKQEQFSHRVNLTEDEYAVCIPTPKFNAVYQMGHIMLHLLDEGIGLRHFVDYYYVLKHLDGLSKEDKQEIVHTWKSTGMSKLASGVMWIEHEVLGLPKEFLLTEPNEKRGKLLLEDILEGGNFGKESNRFSIARKGILYKGIVLGLHNIKLYSLYPTEIPYKLIAKIKSFIKYITKVSIR